MGTASGSEHTTRHARQNRTEVKPDGEHERPAGGERGRECGPLRLREAPWPCGGEGVGGRSRGFAPQERCNWALADDCSQARYPPAWRFSERAATSHHRGGGGSEQPCQPWGGRHSCFRADCAASTLVSGLGLAGVGKAGGGGAGRGDGRVGLRDGAARRWGAVLEVAVRGCGAAAGGAAAASAAWRPPRTFFLDSAGGGLRGAAAGGGVRARATRFPAAAIRQHGGVDRRGSPWRL